MLFDAAISSVQNVMNKALEILAVLLPLILLSNLDAASFKFTNVVCESKNLTWIVFNECRLRVVQRNKIVINMNATLVNPTNKLFVNMQILKKANGYKPWLVNLTIDWCSYTRKHNNPYMNIVFGILRKFAKTSLNCNYAGPLLITNLFISPKMIQLPFPTGDYLVKTIWMANKHTQYVIDVYFAFIED